jgi:hypothetical protein
LIDRAWIVAAFVEGNVFSFFPEIEGMGAVRAEVFGISPVSLANGGYGVADFAFEL